MTSSTMLSAGKISPRPNMKDIERLGCAKDLDEFVAMLRPWFEYLPNTGVLMTYDNEVTLRPSFTSTKQYTIDDSYTGIKCTGLTMFTCLIKWVELRTMRKE